MATGRMTWLLAAGLVWSLPASVLGQGYPASENGRFRFAQTYVGLDVKYTPGTGHGRFLAGGEVVEVDLPGEVAPRLTIGGPHFWGHADFYVSIPVGAVRTSSPARDRRASFDAGVETGGRLYPWRMERGRLRPFVGASLVFGRYEQRSEEAHGPTLSLPRVPLQAGFSRLSSKGLLEVGAQWMPGTRIDYPSSREAFGRASLPSVSAWVGYKYLFDATKGWEDSVDVGVVQRREAELADRGELNSISVAIGLSNALPLRSSSYTRLLRPYLEGRQPSYAIPDIAVGYYHHGLDAAVNLAYRPITQSQSGYGLRQRLRRHAVSFEVTKSLFDYHGFVPFLGASIGRDRLSIRETDNGQLVTEARDTRWAPGVVFGWDIRPTRINWWLLRTNLRYTPRLELDVGPGQSIAFDHLEFNFIQFVAYPQRFFSRR